MCIGSPASTSADVYSWRPASRVLLRRTEITRNQPHRVVHAAIPMTNTPYTPTFHRTQICTLFILSTSTTIACRSFDLWHIWFYPSDFHDRNMPLFLGVLHWASTAPRRMFDEAFFLLEFCLVLLIFIRAFASTPVWCGNNKIVTPTKRLPFLLYFDA